MAAATRSIPTVDLSDYASPKYPPITAGEFLEERLREIGLKK